MDELARGTGNYFIYDSFHPGWMWMEDVAIITDGHTECVTALSRLAGFNGWLDGWLDGWPFFRINHAKRLVTVL